MKAVGMVTMKGIAMSLDLDPEFFTPFMVDSFWVMRLIGYPPLSPDAGDGISCGMYDSHRRSLYI
jgi:isopenicillin N synthase-like dioxygenase